MAMFTVLYFLLGISLTQTDEYIESKLTELEISTVVCGGWQEEAPKHKVDFSGLSLEAHLEFCLAWSKQG